MSLMSDMRIRENTDDGQSSSSKSFLRRKNSANSISSLASELLRDATGYSSEGFMWGISSVMSILQAAQLPFSNPQASRVSSKLFWCSLIIVVLMIFFSLISSTLMIDIRCFSKMEIPSSLQPTILLVYLCLVISFLFFCFFVRLLPPFLPLFSPFQSFSFSASLPSSSQLQLILSVPISADLLVLLRFESRRSGLKDLIEVVDLLVSGLRGADYNSPSRRRLSRPFPQMSSLNPLRGFFISDISNSKGLAFLSLLARSFCLLSWNQSQSPFSSSPYLPLISSIMEQTSFSSSRAFWSFLLKQRVMRQKRAMTTAPMMRKTTTEVPVCIKQFISQTISVLFHQTFPFKPQQAQHSQSIFIPPDLACLPIPDGLAPRSSYNLMGNDLEKEYGLKEKPLKLSGSYNFLKFADHPSDPSTTLIIVKHPHRAGVVVSDIIVPIKEIKPLGHSDYSLALCSHCKPLALVKPRSEVEMKLIIKEIIKLGSEVGRIFLCRGRLMLWCEETRSQWERSPEQIETGKKSDKSNVFSSGLCLVNYLHFVYDTDLKKKRDKKPELENFFNPKDKREYLEFVHNLKARLARSSFWNCVSEGMKNLILVMLARDPIDRIGLETLMRLPYFAVENQLRLYHMVADDLDSMQEKETIILMETIELAIRDKVVFDELIIEEYLTPVLVSQLHKKPEMIISCLVELPRPPVKDICIELRKVKPKNIRFFSNVLVKTERLHAILNQEEYDAGISRTAFCRYTSNFIESFECEQLIDKMIRNLPFIMRTVKEPNYRKEIELQLILNVLENQAIKPPTLLLGLKCMIHLIQEGLLSNINKIYGLKFDPYKFEEELQVNIHILQLYRLMIVHIDHGDLISVMVPKLEPYLVKEEVTDELFFMAKKSMDSILARLAAARELNPNDDVQIEYEREFFEMAPAQKPGEQELMEVLKREAVKSKNEDIAWLAEIIGRQEHLTKL